jgi:zinc/manganese transport system substrate-binding protein/manganese/iron transport system substrate-binding protein
MRGLPLVSAIGALVFGLTLLLAACGDAQPAAPATSGASDTRTPAPGALRVVATTTQIADFARQVGGDLVAVTGILPPNADPHDFEPTPRDVAKIADAQLVLEHGLNLDAWGDTMVKESGTHATVVVVTTGVQPLPSDEEGMRAGDPHVWFDVANAKIMAANIRDAFSAADPAHAAAYAANATAYLSQLDELDSWIRQQIATVPPANRKLVTNHDAFGYYVKAYGLEFVGSVIPSLDTNAEPSAKDTADLIDKIKAQHVKAIFTEASLNPQLEQQIASEAGVKVVNNLYGDALGPAGSGADTYLGMMRTDTTFIVNALK